MSIVVMCMYVCMRVYVRYVKCEYGRYVCIYVCMRVYVRYLKCEYGGCNEFATPMYLSFFVMTRN